MKFIASGFSRIVIIITLVVVVALVSAFFVVSSFNTDEQTRSTSTQNTNQADIDIPLETASSDIVDDIEKELDTLTEDDYSDSGLSDTALYE